VDGAPRTVVPWAEAPARNALLGLRGA